MPFHEVLFPPDISYSSGGGPKWKTTIFDADSGYEQRNQDWASTRAEYDVSQGIKSQDQMDVLTAFFFARRGRANGFRFKDWNDFYIQQQSLGTGNGSTSAFQLVKTYTSAQTESGETYTYTRPLTKINWNTVAGVTIDGVVVTSDQYSVDCNTGIITFNAAPTGDYYEGAASATPIAYGSSGVFTGFPQDVAFGPVNDAPNGFFYVLGSAPDGTRGLRRMNSDTGALVGEHTGASLNLGSVAGIVAVAQDGSIIVSGGENDCNPLYSLNPNTFATQATWGTAHSGPGDSASVGAPSRSGCVSGDGSLLMTMDKLNRITVHNTLTLALSKVVDLTAVSSEAITVASFSPLDNTAFAILCTDGTNVFLVDDTASIMISIPDADASVRFCVTDTGQTPGIVFGWQSGSTLKSVYNLAKYEHSSGKILWQIAVPALPAVNSMDAQAQCINRFAYFESASVYVVDTTIGAVIPQAATAPGSQTFDASRSALICTGGAQGSGDVILDLNTAALTVISGAEVIIGYAEFHVPVRFDQDHLNAVHDFWMTQSWSSIPLLEVRDWSNVVTATTLSAAT